MHVSLAQIFFFYDGGLWLTSKMDVFTSQEVFSSIWSRNMEESVVQTGALVATLSSLSSVSVVPQLCALWCVQPEVSCQRLWWARREEEGGRECVRGKGRLRKRARRKSLILPISEFSHSQSTATHSSASIPHFFRSSLFLFIASHLLSLTLITLCTFLSLSHTHVWADSHTPPLQLGKIQRLPPFPESFQFGTEPLGHCGTAQCLHTPPY